MTKEELKDIITDVVRSLIEDQLKVYVEHSMGYMGSSTVKVSLSYDGLEIDSDEDTDYIDLD